jgi:hypothetical protein
LLPKSCNTDFINTPNRTTSGVNIEGPSTHSRLHYVCVCAFVSPHLLGEKQPLISHMITKSGLVYWAGVLSFGSGRFWTFFPILVKKDIVNSTNRIDFLSANIWSETSTQTFCPISNRIKHHTWRNFANINQFWRQLIDTVRKFIIIIDEELCGYTPRKPYVKPLQLLVGQL